jgi:lipopolysaccharide-induced tumor necrosis factor-alpha factor
LFYQCQCPEEPDIAIVDAVAVVPVVVEEEVHVPNGDSNHNNNNNNDPSYAVPEQVIPPKQHNALVVQVPTAPHPIPPKTHPQQPPRPVVVYGHLGRYECNIQCPFCAEMIVTETRTRCDVVTWLFFVLLLFFFWPLCWLPFCMPTCQGVHHYCPRCHRQVGATDSCS